MNKLASEIERRLLASPEGLTHAELAKATGYPEPSVRRALQVIRAGKPRFKAGQGMFDIVEKGSLMRGVTQPKIWVVKWREAQATRSYDPTEVKVTITGEDGTKHEIKSSVEHVRRASSSR